jgi:protoheme IX farnesyltransferase
VCTRLLVGTSGDAGSVARFSSRTLGISNKLVKATAESLNGAQPLDGERPVAVAVTSVSPPVSLTRSWGAVFAELFKARLTTLVLLTTLVGFYVGSVGQVNYLLMFHTLLGTAFVAAGASALNQLLEWKYDAKMRRTRGRPLPAGLLQPQTVLWIGSACSCMGVIYLASMVNAPTSLLGLVSLLSYLFIYTPLKRVSWLNTAAGAIPGALPPLMGWAAARGELSGPGWTLFAILALWQLPHFLSIAWIYRDEYARAGFRMLPGVDPTGARTGRQAVFHTAGLMLVSLCPFIFGLAGRFYFIGAFLFGAAFLYSAIQFRRYLTVVRAKHLFLTSIIYLPLLLGLLVIDKIK